MSSRLQTTTAHRGSATACVYSADFSNVVSGGKDSLIKSHDVKVATSAPKIVAQLSEPITCLAVSKDHIAVGTEDSKVSLLDYPSGKNQKTLVHFTLPIRCVAFSPDGRWVAAGSDEPTIRVVSVADISNIKVFKGHSKSVRSVAFDPKGDYLVSTSIDGSVRIWDMQDSPENACLKEFKNVLPASEVDSLDRLAVSWSPDGKKFAIPGRKDAVVIEGETWLTLFNLSGTHTAPIDIVAWSPSGTHVATIDKGNDAHVVVWDTRTKSVVSKQSVKSRILGFTWDATGQTASFVDVDGTLSTWKSVVSKDSSASKPKTEAPAQTSFFDDEVKESKPKEAKGGARIPGLDDSEDEGSHSDDDDDAAVFSDEDGVGDGFIVDDDGAGYAEYGIDIPRKETARRSGPSRPRFGEGPTDFPMAMGGGIAFQPTAHRTFQPGSTPAKPGKTTRYLAFNLTGLIYTIDQSTHSTVHVEFHDRSAQRPFSFTDHYNYSMATLGERGALFACESAMGSPSRVFYHPFETWATKSEWQAELSEGENIKAIALSTRGAHIATDHNYLRTFSYSGVQTHVMSLPGPIVTMCAGADDSLIIVYTAGAGVAKAHNLGYLLYDATEMTCMRKDSVPVSPSADLQWIGYSETGNICTYDSVGILRVLMPHSDYIWVPMLDSRVAKGEKVESYWPVGLTETDFMCVIVKGAGDPYPTYPNRLISQLPIQAPLLHVKTPSGALEEEYFRRKLLTTHAKGAAALQGTLEDKETDFVVAEKEMDKLLLKLILAAIKAEKLQRALDLTMLLNLPRSIDGAVKIAISDHFPGLAERMNLIKEAKLIKNQAEEERKGEMTWASRESNIRSASYRDRPAARSPANAPSRQRDDRLDTAIFGDEAPSRRSLSPVAKSSRKEDSRRDDHRSKPLQEKLKQKRDEKPKTSTTVEPAKRQEKSGAKFNPFAVSMDSKPAEQPASSVSNLLNAMEESERQKADKDDATARKRKQQKPAETEKGAENAPPKRVRTLDSMFGFKPAAKKEKEEQEQTKEEEESKTAVPPEEAVDTAMD